MEAVKRLHFDGDKAKPSNCRREFVDACCDKPTGRLSLHLRRTHTNIKKQLYVPAAEFMQENKTKEPLKANFPTIAHVGKGKNMEAVKRLHFDGDKAKPSNCRREFVDACCD